ncbi:MAG: phosphoglycerate dehydrogenase [Candidatus Marinimicrobia bacterium]|nr:phosphoglycerate dehydrogenase [Candidatus Neomarinimicrobiota bacterium]
MMKILLLENIHENAEEFFKNEGYAVETHSSSLEEEELIKNLQDVQVVGIRSKTDITENVLENAPDLLAVGAFCIGTNQIDLEACSKAGVAVFNAPYSNTRSVVELTVSNIIALLRKVFDRSKLMHNGRWEKSAKDSFEVRGKKLGIIGYGNIGSQLSVLAEALGMKVYFYDIDDKLPLGNAQKCSSMQNLLEISDIVSVHVDGRESNHNLIDEDEFEQMKDGAIFINASRGFVVNIKALAKHLKSGKLKGAAIDVYPEEPKVKHTDYRTVLQNLPNTILTPHIGGSTEEAQRNIADFVPTKLNDFIKMGSTVSSVNFPNLQLPQINDEHRIVHVHENIPGIMGKLNNIFASNNINIERQFLKTRRSLGYVITDIKKEYNAEILDEVKNIKGTIRVRLLY